MDLTLSVYKTNIVFLTVLQMILALIFVIFVMEVRAVTYYGSYEHRLQQIENSVEAMKENISHMMRGIIQILNVVEKNICKYHNFTTTFLTLLIILRNQKQKRCLHKMGKENMSFEC